MAAPERVPDAPSHQTLTQDKAPILVPEEIDSSKWAMPPWTPIGIVLLVILVAMGILSYVTRPQPKLTGEIEDVFAVPLPENNVMVTMKVNLHNVGGKAIWIRNLKVKLVTEKGEYPDDAANAVDFPRYTQAFPDIRQHTITPIKVEDKIYPSSQERGSIIARFPVSMEEFSLRKSVSVIVEPYDLGPITITK